MLDPSKISCCLITKEYEYPQVVLDHLTQFGFGEILIQTMCDSPHRKHEVFARAENDLIYYQDDDAICPVKELLELSRPDIINVAMKQGHFDAHQGNRATMGLGWGAIFPKSILGTLKKYTDVHGEDPVFKRETERILTYLNYPQNRLVLPIMDLPSASDSSRLWRQPDHGHFKALAEGRSEKLL